MVPFCMSLLVHVSASSLFAPFAEVLTQTDDSQLFPDENIL